MFQGTRLQVATYFLIVCLLSITFLVFVNASISFVVTDILKKRDHVGDDVGTLGFVDELIAMVACPAWGVLSDKTGVRLVVVISYSLIAISMFLFVNTSHVYPDLLLVRILFSLGGAGASTMVTAILPSLTKSTTGRLPMTSQVNDEGNQVIVSSSSTPMQRPALVEATDEAKPSSSDYQSGSFRLAGFVGTAAGCGALLAVFGFLRLPPYFQEQHMAADVALSDTFYIVGGVAFLAALIAFFGLRGMTTSVAMPKQKSSPAPFWKMPYSAFLAGLQNNGIALSYLGGFVARASSVGISLFIPLWINSFYIQSGRCRIDDPADVKSECRDAYKLSSSITGVSQLVALLAAPLFGIAAERMRQNRAPIMLASAAGVASYTVLAFTKDPRIREGDLGPYVFIIAALIGLSQVGAIVCSLGLLGHEIALSESVSGHSSTQSWHSCSASGLDQGLQSDNGHESTDEDPLLGPGSTSPASAHTEVQSLGSIKGSIAGMYSFAGGVGILLLTKIGGLLFDRDSAAPFWLMAGFNIILLLGATAGVVASFVSQRLASWKSKSRATF